MRPAGAESLPVAAVAADLWVVVTALILTGAGARPIPRSRHRSWRSRHDVTSRRRQLPSPLRQLVLTHRRSRQVVEDSGDGVGAAFCLGSNNLLGTDSAELEARVRVVSVHLVRVT